MKQHYLLIAVLKTILAKSNANDIVWTIEEDACSDPEDEYWDDLWEDYSNEFESKEEMIQDSSFQDDCLDTMGDTGHFFEDPKVLPKNTWLIHFTKADPTSILKRGFYGASLQHLGLTKGGGKREPGNYALAYDLNDFDEDDDLNSMYGYNLILFQSNIAVKAYHRGDDEDQVIFDVRAIRKPSMFGFERTDQSYAIFNHKAEYLEERPVELKSLKPSKKKPSDIPF